ncbi:hypothetical protein LCGC14_3088550 [marine sediment metagenome]|uniref:Uncharacterized protein n=1 Tax=marine sediment metagenome TaxID=412755 RepID=A0A0F8WZV5_9ZZZZ
MLAWELCWRLSHSLYSVRDSAVDGVCAIGRIGCFRRLLRSGAVGVICFNIICFGFSGCFGFFCSTFLYIIGFFSDCFRVFFGRSLLSRGFLWFRFFSVTFWYAISFFGIGFLSRSFLVLSFLLCFFFALWLSFFGLFFMVFFIDYSEIAGDRNRTCSLSARLILLALQSALPLCYAGSFV